MAEVRLFLTRLTAMVLLIWVLFGLIFGICPMKNEDMMPRISSGDLLFYYRLPRAYTAGEVVVFTAEGKQYVGRVAARGGDTVEVTDAATLIINGSTVAEPDIYETTPKYESAVIYPLTLADGEYFILCDAREGTRDSRWFGAVPAAAIRGRVIAVVRRGTV